jgi:hypothetical protein
MNNGVSQKPWKSRHAVRAMALLGGIVFDGDKIVSS